MNSVEVKGEDKLSFNLAKESNIDLDCPSFFCGSSMENAVDEMQEKVEVSEAEVVLKLTGEAAANFKKAMKAEANGSPDRAFFFYKKVSDEVPNFPFAWSNLGNVLVGKGKLEEALVNYNKAIELIPSESDALWLVRLNRGTTLLALGQNKAALDDLEFATSHFSRKEKPEASLLANYAIAKERNGDYQGALRAYELAVKANPTEVTPFWLHYALAAFQEEGINQGLQLLRRVQARFPDADEVKAAAAAMEYLNGDFAAAKKSWFGVVDPLRYQDKEFLSKSLYWPPALVDALLNFRSEAGTSAFSKAL